MLVKLPEGGRRLSEGIGTFLSQMERCIAPVVIWGFITWVSV